MPRRSSAARSRSSCEAKSKIREWDAAHLRPDRRSFAVDVARRPGLLHANLLANIPANDFREDRPMLRTKPPFRADVVGSILRTAPLKEARAKRDKGEISAAQL